MFRTIRHRLPELPVLDEIDFDDALPRPDARALEPAGVALLVGRASALADAVAHELHSLGWQLVAATRRGAPPLLAPGRAVALGLRHHVVDVAALGLERAVGVALDRLALDGVAIGLVVVLPGMPGDPRAFAAAGLADLAGEFDDAVAFPAAILHAATRRMIEAGAGRVAIATSALGHFPAPWLASAAAANAWWQRFGLAFAVELADTGVEVTTATLAPTELVDAIAEARPARGAGSWLLRRLVRLAQRARVRQSARRMLGANARGAMAASDGRWLAVLLRLLPLVPLTWLARRAGELLRPGSVARRLPLLGRRGPDLPAAEATDEEAAPADPGAAAAVDRADDAHAEAPTASPAVAEPDHEPSRAAEAQAPPDATDAVTVDASAAQSAADGTPTRRAVEVCDERAATRREMPVLVVERDAASRAVTVAALPAFAGEAANDDAPGKRARDGVDR